MLAAQESDDDWFLLDGPTAKQQLVENNNEEDQLDNDLNNHEGEGPAPVDRDIARGPAEDRGQAAIAPARMGLRDGSKLRKPNKYNVNIAIFRPPITYEEALEGPDAKNWRKAIENELKQHEKNKTWELVPKHPGMRTIDSKWVFRATPGSEKQDFLFKARLCARGFLQKEGLDYTETFAPVVRYDSLRVLLAHVAQEDLETVTFDVKSAFLYGDLEEEIFMEVPKGVCVNKSENVCGVNVEACDESGDANVFRGNVVCKLRKSLYGLKQAPRCWNIKFKRFLNSFNFCESEADKCIFIGEYRGHKVYLALFVDDGLLVCKSIPVIKHILSELHKHFEITIGDSSYFVGLEIHRDRAKKSLTINQSAYIEHVLNKFRMSEANPVCVPADINVHLRAADKNAVRECNAPYREVIGSLMYLAMATRPDISYTVSYLSRFQNGYDNSHWQAVKRLLAYLKGSINLGLEYRSNKEPINLIGYSDSDYAGCLETRRSTSGYVFIMAGASVTWASRRQELVTLSTTESEYVAAATAAREALWLKKLLKDLGYQCESGIVLHVDNQSAICLTKDSRNHRRTKHIDTRYHFLKERCESGDISVIHVSSKEQKADVFTKALPKGLFNKMRESLGLVEICLKL